MTEMDILRSIRLALSERGWCVFRANVGAVHIADGRWFDTGLPAGFSDLFAAKDGRVVFLEVKTATGKVRKDQKMFLRVMQERYHCVAGVVRSVEDAVELAGKAEAVHAHWIDRDHGYQMCSHCFKEVAEDNECPWKVYGHCPHCGAIMDEEVGRDANI